MKKSAVESSCPLLVRLNKFISNAGICARRAADDLITSGSITVDGVVVSKLGIKIPLDAVVTYKGTRISIESHKYILLNKPKGYVTTLHDPQGRKTVLDLVNKKYCSDHIYPVGRLDYETTGVLLLTNDGDLAGKLAHPTYKITKRYHVVLDKPIVLVHLAAIKDGISLEDGLAKVDAIAIAEQDPTQLILEIHMGKNRIIRRLFDHLGYLVVKLDRIGYAHLTKKGIPRGKWIFLQQKEVHQLKKLV